jgi:outer membrane receptor for ferrienterochelin and colicin
VARPSIRELSDAAIYDNEFRTLIYGNSDLKMAHITNYDFRGEVYFANGDNVSASVFYKDFRNHIEMGFGGSGITWDNIEKSTVRGIEVEGKKQLGQHLEFRANLTLVKSEAEFVRKDLQIIDGKKVYTIIDTLYRPMFGQAPYLFNSILSYTADSLGLTATVSYNVQGPRLVITGVVKGRPDVYEIPRNTIDAKISKKLGKYFSVNLTIRDILNAPVRRAYKLPSGWVDYDKFRYGTNYVLGISYKL